MTHAEHGRHRPIGLWLGMAMATLIALAALPALAADTPEQIAIRLYPALNHLGIAVEDDGNRDQDTIPGHVDTQLIADIAAWIRTGPSSARPSSD